MQSIGKTARAVPSSDFNWAMLAHALLLNDKPIIFKMGHQEFRLTVESVAKAEKIGESWLFNIKGWSHDITVLTGMQAPPQAMIEVKIINFNLSNWLCADIWVGEVKK